MRTKIDVGDFAYHSGQSSYSFGLPEGKDVNLRFVVSADEKIACYLTNTRTDEILPLGEEASWFREYQVNGFDQFLIRAKKSAKIAAKVEASSAESRDPLDYKPVKVDEPLEIMENNMLKLWFHQKMQSMGLDPDNYEDGEVTEEDFEFFEDNDGELPSPFIDDFEGQTFAERVNEAEENNPAQPEEEAPAEEIPSAGETISENG